MPEDEEKLIKQKEEHPDDKGTGLSWFMKRKGYKMPPNRETVKAELRKIPGLEMPSKKPPMMGEEESGTGKGDYTKWHRIQQDKKMKSPLTKIKEKLVGEEQTLDKEGLEEFYDFFCWLMDKGMKHPGSPEEFEKLYNQFEVEKFSEGQKADPSMFEGLNLDPKPKMPKKDTTPPLTKKTVTNLTKKIRSGV